MSLTGKEYLDTLKEAVETGHKCSMLLTGSSMEPFLTHGRDTIWFCAPEQPIRRGDMAFFQREDGQYVMHRVQKVTNDGFYLVGDNQTEIEGPVPGDRIFAVVYQVRRKGKILGPKSFWWRFFATVWLRMIPLRPGLIRLYRRLFTS
jgi:phage repressor protein C with HTH and peptisase S24 domain